MAHWLKIAGLELGRYDDMYLQYYEIFNFLNRFITQHYLGCTFPLKFYFEVLSNGLYKGIIF